MKKNYFFKTILLLIPVAAFVLMSSSGGRDDARSGSPGDGGNTCSACHGGGAFNTSANITTNIPASGYELNKNYTITLNSVTSSNKLGFQLTAENNSNTKIGTFTAGSGSRVSGQRVTHSAPSPTGDWVFTWKSPSINQGTVTFYAAVNATNGNGSTSGDEVVTTNTSVNVLGNFEAKLLNFKVYPNPSSEKVAIQLSNEFNNAKVEFYDYVGRLALSSKVTSENNYIEVNSLSSGIYLIKVIADHKIGTQKFIKQ